MKILGTIQVRIMQASGEWHNRQVHQIDEKKAQGSISVRAGKAGRQRVNISLWNQDFPSEQVIPKKYAFDVETSYSASSHRDCENNLWYDLNWYGRLIPVKNELVNLWLSTPKPETWEYIWIWARLPTGEIVHERMDLPEDSRATLKKLWEQF